MYEYFQIISIVQVWIRAVEIHVLVYPSCMLFLGWITAPFVKGEGGRPLYSQIPWVFYLLVCSDCHILVEVCIRLLKIMNNIWPTTMQLIFEWVQRRSAPWWNEAMRKNLSGNDARDWIGQSTLVFLLISIIVNGNNLSLQLSMTYEFRYTWYNN